jgi:TRAP-type mannitol/chloroaromatic compound transport system permease small subunit
MKPKGRALVDVIGILIFLLPLCIFLAWKAVDFVALSWNLKEASRESGGLPYPFIPLLKTIIVVMPVTVGLQGISLLLRSVRILRGL